MQPDGHGLDRWSVGPKRAGRVVRGASRYMRLSFFFSFSRSAVFLRDHSSQLHPWQYLDYCCTSYLRLLVRRGVENQARTSPNQLHFQ
jgi:hypothetical protein